MVTPVRYRVVSVHRFVPKPRGDSTRCKWCGRDAHVHLVGVPITTYVCDHCGVGMPNAAIYKNFHAEHCPNIGAQR